MAKKTTALLRAAAALPWMITPEKLEAVFTLLEMHARGERRRPEEIRQHVSPRAAKSGSTTVQPGSHKQVAVLPLFGVLTQRASSLEEMSGATSTEQFAKQFQALVDNPQISAIVLHIDSPGGSTFGIPEAAAIIRAGREQKPVYAVADSTMASAAYYLGAQATEVIASPSSLVGSVGVYMVHYDDTEALEQLGLERTVISAGAHKAEGMGALSDDAVAHLQAIVDEIYATMIADIAEGRGVTTKEVEANYGQGRVFTAQAAVDAGLVDRVATLDELLAELTAQPASDGRTRAHARTLNIAASADPPPLLTEPQLDRLIAAARSGGFSVPAANAPGIHASAAPNASLVLHPTTAAPKANKEQTVPDPTTVAQPSGATPEQLAALARADRNDRIAELCALVGASASDVLAFQASDKTVVQVREELQARGVKPTPIAGAPQITGMRDREADKPFARLGEQLMAIADYNSGKGLDKRLMGVQAAASGASANVPSDGAFLIQKDFAADLNKDAFNEGQLAADCSMTEVSDNSDGLLVAYVDETSRATGSRWGGIQVYRTAEADSATAKKPKIGEWECRVYDITGLAYMTNRLLRDASAMQSVFKEGFNAEFAFVVDDEIVRGTGAGQCLGLLNSPALVTVTKETGQAVDTVVAENIQKMWGRLLPRAKATATWYINQEIEQQLQNMQIGTGTSAQLVYMPAGGLSGSQFGTIYGRPVKVVEQCSAPGDVGDVILSSLGQAYKLVTKDGLQADESIHVKFITNEMTFRWIKRVGGAPKLKSALTPYKGTATLSDHVTLGAR